jgi:hypothetical protein
MRLYNTVISLTQVRGARRELELLLAPPRPPAARRPLGEAQQRTAAGEAPDATSHAQLMERALHKFKNYPQVGRRSHRRFAPPTLNILWYLLQSSCIGSI